MRYNVNLSKIAESAKPSPIMTKAISWEYNFATIPPLKILSFKWFNIKIIKKKPNNTKNAINYENIHFIVLSFFLLYEYYYEKYIFLN